MRSEEIPYEERVYERRIYPWDGHNVRNSSQKNRGEMMANFVRGRGDYMGVAGSLNDNGSITTDVKSYWPNDYGLYCMAGNVNEWVKDVYRPLTSEDVDGFNPFRGNVYTDVKRDANGSVVGKEGLEDFILIQLKIWMLQTDTIIRKAITEITETETWNQQYLLQLTGILRMGKKAHSECTLRIILPVVQIL